MGKQHYLAIHFLLVIILGLLIYSQSLRGPFVFDDISNIKENPIIHELSLFASLEALSVDSGQYDAIQHAVRTRYISYLTFAFNYAIHGLETFGYHLVNLLIHIGNALLLYLLVCQLLKLPAYIGRCEYKTDESFGCQPALLASLIFLCHPIQTQAVSYIVQRMTSLATFFLLLAVCMYLSAMLSKSVRIHRLYLMAALICGLMGALTKEFAALLPVYIVVLEFFNQQDSFKSKLSRISVFLLVPILPLLMLFGFGSKDVFAEKVADITAGPSLGAVDYFLTQLLVIPQYFKLLVWPVGQAVDHDVIPAQTFFEPGVLTGSILLLVWVGLLVWYTRRPQLGTSRKVMAIAGWCSFIAIMPESSFFPIADLMFEHRMYFPMVWISIFVGFLLTQVSQTFFSNKHKFFMLLIGLVIISLSVTSWKRDKLWSDAEPLWRDAVEQSPNKARPHNNLAKVLEEKGKYEGALQHYNRAVALAPADPRIRFNHARNLQRIGSVPQAIEAYRMTLKLNPSIPEAHYNLGQLLLRQRDFVLAEKSFLKFLELSQEQNHYGLSQQLEALHVLGNLLRNQAKFIEADGFYLRALKEDPQAAIIQNDYAISLAEQSRYNEAEALFRRSIAGEDCFSEAYNNLGALLMITGRNAEARDVFTESLICDPNNKQALINLKRVKSGKP